MGKQIRSDPFNPTHMGRRGLSAVGGHFERAYGFAEAHLASLHALLRHRFPLIGAAVALMIPLATVVVLWNWVSGFVEPATVDQRNALVLTLAQIVGGFLVLTGLAFTALNWRTNREGQITERFTRAIEQLGSEKRDVRLGGIYALERIANDSGRDYWPIVEVLTAFLRSHNQWPPDPPSGEPDPPARRATQRRTIGALADTQAVLSVLARRKHRYGANEPFPLNLSQTDLEFGFLEGAHLENADLRSSRLDRAGLSRARFGHRARLERASLRDAHLDGAFLSHAELDGADLRGAHLEGALLEAADLRRADLRGAFLIGARLNGANLAGADLSGADLTSATGLTQQQIDKSYMNDRTRLPVERTPNGKPLQRSARRKLDVWSEWALTPDWGAVDGALVNHGTGEYSESRWISAPFLSEGGDFIVVAEIKVEQNMVACPSFGITACAEDGLMLWAGIVCTSRVAVLGGAHRAGNEIAQRDFVPNSDWQPYRLEVNGETLGLSIDGARMIYERIERRGTRWHLGLWSDRVKLSVRSFRFEPW